jgi:hypothetical protein
MTTMIAEIKAAKLRGPIGRGRCCGNRVVTRASHNPRGYVVGSFSSRLGCRKLSKHDIAEIDAEINWVGRMTGARERYEAKKREERRLQEERQDRSKWWFRQHNPVDRFTGWLVAWTALLCVTTVLSVIVLNKTDHTLQRTVVATQRPWISGKPTLTGSAHFIPDGSGLVQHFQITLKNVGNSVATFVEQEFSIIVPADDGHDKIALQTQKEACTGARKRIEKSDHSRPMALFPSEENTSLYNLFVSSRNMKVIGSVQWINPVLIGCVAYKSEFSEETHETGLIYVIRKKLSNVPSGGLLTLGQDVTKEDLELYGGTTFAH